MAQSVCEESGPGTGRAGGYAQMWNGIGKCLIAEMTVWQQAWKSTEAK